MHFSRCELLLGEAGSLGRGEFGNTEQEGRPPLETAIKQQLAETVTG
jgi:hypothetical protein